MLLKKRKTAYLIFGIFLIIISMNSIVYFQYFLYKNENVYEIHLHSSSKQENNDDLSVELQSLQSSSSLTAKNGYAIIIGISDYPDYGNDLSYCDEDAQDVYNMLINEYNFKSENIIYLQDSVATFSAINAAFDTINAQIHQDDVFFFYYSGHGGASLTNEGIIYYSIDSPHPYPDYYDNIWDIYYPDAAYISVYFDHFETEYGYDWVYLGDTDLYSGWYYEAYSGYSDGFWSDWIPLLGDNTFCVRFVSDYTITDWGFSIDKYEVITYDGTHYLCSYDSIPSSPENYYLDTLIDTKLDSMNAAEKYIITDSCNSGGIIPEVQDTGRYVITACSDYEFSLECPYLEHGVFTNFFLESIDSAVDSNGDGVRSIGECFSYTYSNTVSYSGSMGYTYHPQQYDGITGEGVLSTAFGGIALVPVGNNLSYSFTLYGTGLVEELRIVVYDDSAGINYNMVDLTEIPASNTGFGNYSGNLQLDGFSGLSGYGIYAKISGERELILSETTGGDTDGDTLDDALEIMMELDPESIDSDNDGLTDDTEFHGDTDPTLSDTDSDGLIDGDEVLVYLTDPCNPDSDGDGWNDGLEVMLFLDPLDPSITLITLILNVTGIPLMAALVALISRRHVKNKKIPKIPKKSLYHYSEIDKSETQNILRLEKKMRPIPTSYQTRPVYSPKISYAQPRTNQLPASLNDLKSLILYGTPTPKSAYSQEGKRLIAIAEQAFFNLNTGRIKEGFDGMVIALMSGVPEPMNSRIKVILLDFLNKLDNNGMQNVAYKSPDTKKCPNCDVTNPIKNNFCINCGRSFN